MHGPINIRYIELIGICWPGDGEWPFVSITWKFYKILTLSNLTTKLKFATFITQPGWNQRLCRLSVTNYWVWIRVLTKPVFLCHSRISLLCRQKKVVFIRQLLKTVHTVVYVVLTPSWLTAPPFLPLSAGRDARGISRGNHHCRWTRTWCHPARYRWRTATVEHAGVTVWMIFTETRADRESNFMERRPSR